MSQSARTLRVDGTHVRVNIHYFLQSSFVEQEDALLGTLTARETLTFALQLSSPKARPESVRQRVDDVIDMLGLQSCADIQIGNPLRRGLSGGQKRRVSIGCSLVTYP